MIGRLFFIVVMVWLCGPSAFSAATPAAEWPLSIEGARVPITLYQPQPESFKEDQLTARAAISVHPEGHDAVFGAVWIEARVDTDRDARTVSVEKVKITRTRFVNATPEQEQTLSMLLTEALTQKNFVISLDRLLVSLENAENEMKSAENLNMNPPKIYVEKSEAILLVLDGDPQLRPMKDSSDMRVVNTPFELFFRPTSKTYRLKAGDQWLSATDLHGTWTFEGKSTATLPSIIVSKEPAELIVSKGEPTFKPLAGSDLLYMSNTESHVFLETATSKMFVLLSGRWFSAPKLEGPWTFVKPDALPAAFAKIPADSPKAAVRASVAGTEEAKEAVLDAQIPQTATVSRKEKDEKLKIAWDGEPKFKEIDNLPVAYSLNASGAVFRVGKSGYWACDQGIWYMSKNPTGPWVVATSVPKEIYDIPPTCPYYNTKYVRVYDSTPEVVYVGYYPGYVGSYPYYGTMVYGTGYYYSGWYGPVHYYPPPMMTWGFAYRYNPYYGWGAGVSWSVSENVSFSIGWSMSPGYWWGPGGYYPVPIVPVRPINNRPRVEHHAKQNLYNKAQDSKGAGARVDSRIQNGKDNNVFADRDGNVHRKTKDGWQKNTGDGWASDKSANRKDLQRDAAVRDRGAQRASQATPRNTRLGTRPAGGGMRGGGGRRR